MRIKARGRKSIYSNSEKLPELKELYICFLPSVDLPSLKPGKEMSPIKQQPTLEKNRQLVSEKLVTMVMKCPEYQLFSGAHPGGTVGEVLC